MTWVAFLFGLWIEGRWAWTGRAWMVLAVLQGAGRGSWWPVVEALALWYGVRLWRQARAEIQRERRVQTWLALRG